MCDSCFDQYGPKDSSSSPGSADTGGPASPVKMNRRQNKDKDTEQLPAEYLASPLSKQVGEPNDYIILSI